ncbi:mid region of cactin-domain-containing protein [Mycotypha africana]|uniref:mid region of cactin-domain-containing protein n=1 Tax=Mycotypha africana TaxID=64632 RepID=UPI0023008C5E|nr:mid region of cactin-domain-containing protein [Mycotypha africana]KAI8984360.1 mid region of cactin-domain-containing protein [Mycotypha africana]
MARSHSRSQSPDRHSRHHSTHRHRSRHDSSERKSRRRHRSRSKDDDRRDRKRRQRDRSESPKEKRKSKSSRSSSGKHKKDKNSNYDEHYHVDAADLETDPNTQSASRPTLESLGYSNVSNPFNDVNLESKFVWGKKKQRDKKRLGLSEKEIEEREKARKREADEELAKLNKRRAERERELELREEEHARMQRDAELAQMGDWEAKEEEFHLEQAKQRAAIRIRDGRAKPIDILAMNLRLAHEPDKVEDEVDLEIDLEEPYKILDNLYLDDAVELHQDIQMHLALEKNPKTLEFWRAMIVVADDYLAKLRANQERNQQGPMAVEANIHRILDGKSVAQLSVLQNQIQQKLASNEPIDVEYWEHLLKELVVYKAKARLTEMHQEILAKRLEQLRNKQREEAQKVQEELGRVLSMQSAEVHGQGVGEGEGIKYEPVDEDMMEAQDERFIKDQSVTPAAPAASAGLLLEEYDRSMSPEPMQTLSNEDSEMEILDPAADLKELMEKRRVVLNTAIIPKQIKQDDDGQGLQGDGNDNSMASSALFEQEAAKGIDEDEDLFNLEAELAKQTYNWQDKYRPRKPRYFNRVHTGYEWNKYNQTHYDMDNPPPKVVQGYKFNIFYPDLINPSKAPTYFIEKDPESPDTVLIRFHAGPPYEDIAFRIVNREWEYSHKKGFRCSFDRGVLSLWFHFKRQFYRK